MVWARDPAVPGEGRQHAAGAASPPGGEEGCERGDVRFSASMKAASLF